MVKARAWAERNKDYLRERRKTYSTDSLRWAQDVEAAPTLKVADKLISDAIKWSL